MKSKILKIIILPLMVFVAIDSLIVYVGIPLKFEIPKESITDFGGHAYTIRMPIFWPITYRGDTPENTTQSRTQLHENAVTLGPAHTMHNIIMEGGSGAYSHAGTGKFLIFSATDNSDPRDNGFTYEVDTRAYTEAYTLWALITLLFFTCIVYFKLPNTITKRDLIDAVLKVAKPFIISTGVAVSAFYLGTYTQGVLFWLLITAALIAVIYIIASGAMLLTYLGRNEPVLLPYHKTALVIFGLMLSVMLFEGYFALLEAKSHESSPAGMIAEDIANNIAIDTATPTDIVTRPHLPDMVTPNNVATDIEIMAGVDTGDTTTPNLETENVTAGGYPADTIRDDTTPVQIAAENDSYSLVPRLALVEKYQTPLKQEAINNIVRRNNVLTLPQQWERKPVQVKGSYNSYYWHESLHVHDENYFRRSTPFPAKDPEKFRLMIVGDSMTYGYGVDEKYIYTTLLQEMLGNDYHIEVLNLGRSGAQTEDILEILRKFLPVLQPDLVFYGVVSNDFLPSQTGQYSARGFFIPLPEQVKKYFMDRSRVSRFISDSYAALLRTFGLRNDFFEDILQNFDGYQIRFANDVVHMNEEVTNHGLPPVIAMMLDQLPEYGGRGYTITQVAERALSDAGMKVIPLEDYYKRYDGINFQVSLWEGHADEQSHAIFASMILPHIVQHPGLQKFRKQTNPESNQAINHDQQ